MPIRIGMNQMSQPPTAHKPDPALATAVTLKHVQDAATRIKGIAHRTPVLSSTSLTRCTGCSKLHFKCENIQRAGAFKFRGAYNALSSLSVSQRAQGIVTWSSGNHAQAVALAAHLLGIKAQIVMPSDAPRVKHQATQAYLQGTKSSIVTYDRETTSREELGNQLAKKHNLTIIPPYDHPDIIAGQGTVALELFEHVGDLDALFVPLGGGGLLSGCATAAKAVCPSCTVIGVEPALADDAARSFRTHTLHTVQNPPTIADGARTPSLGRYTFSIILDRVDEIITVSEQRIAQTMFELWHRLKTVVEPTGALGAAGLFANSDRWASKRVGVVISGGNVDPTCLPNLLKIAKG